MIINNNFTQWTSLLQASRTYLEIRGFHTCKITTIIIIPLMIKAILRHLCMNSLTNPPVQDQYQTRMPRNSFHPTRRTKYQLSLQETNSLGQFCLKVDSNSMKWYLTLVKLHQEVSMINRECMLISKISIPDSLPIPSLIITTCLTTLPKAQMVSRNTTR